MKLKEKLAKVRTYIFALPQFSKATEHSAPGWSDAVTESSATDHGDTTHTGRAYE
jgi:hypothetical protein